MSYARNDRLGEWIERIGLGVVERERTPEPIVGIGIQLHLGNLSLSNTKQILEKLGVERSRTAIHNWVQKADLQPTGTHASNQVTVDETVIRVGDERHWLYASVDPGTNEFRHIRLYTARNNSTTKQFLQELCEKHSVENSTCLIDEATYLISVLSSLGLRFRMLRHRNRNKVERVFREVRRRTFSFSNMFSHVDPPTAESWLQAFAVWWNRCES
jgi:putative transposase